MADLLPSSGKGFSRFYLPYLILLLSWPLAGENKLRVDGGPWRVHTTPHFDLHFTPDGASLVADTAVLLESSYDRITRDLGVPVSGRTPFFLYTTHNRFEQTNIVDVGEGTGGVTEAFQNRLLIFNNGRRDWLAHVVPHEFTHVVQFEALYGGFWRSARLLKSPFYPLWVMEGLAEYESGEWDRTQEEMILRDAATTGRLYRLSELHGFAHLKPHEVTLGYKQGGAALRYLAETHGVDKPGRLLRALADRFDAGAVVADLTGAPFADFERGYRAWLDNYYGDQARGRTEPEADGTPLTTEDLLPVFNTNPALSPDGRFLAYVTDRRGPREVVFRDLRTGAEEFLAGRPGRWMENLHTEGRGLAFSPDGRWLAFTGEKRQRDFLYLYDLRRGRLRRVRTPFEQIRSPAYSPDGLRLAVSALVEGRSDIYEISTRGRVLRRLTATAADEDEPAYSPDGRSVIFTRERSSDRERPVRGVVELRLDGSSVGDGESLLTASVGDVRSPVFAPDARSILFVADGTERVWNLYRWDRADGTAHRWTNTVGGHFTPTVSSGGTLVFASFRRGSMGLYRTGPERWGAGDPASTSVVSSTFSVLDSSAPVDAEPTRFRVSTDLIFPALYFSSTDGLFAAALWQASERFGDHQWRGTFQYLSSSKFLDYDAAYTYRRFLPDFRIASRGETLYHDAELRERRREREESLAVIVPLDRYDRWETALFFRRIDERDEDDPARNGEERDAAWGVAYDHDTTTGRYLTVTSGRRFRWEHRWARPVAGYRRDYHTQTVEFHQFQPTGRESVLAFRGRAGVSRGASPEAYRLGGVDRLRGVSRMGDEHRSTRYALSNMEWRVPLTDLDWRGGAFFSGVAIKALYGAVFSDFGYDGEAAGHRWLHSVGAGVRFPSFAFQSFPFLLSIDAAKRTDNRHWTWYVSLGQNF